MALFAQLTGGQVAELPPARLELFTARTAASPSALITELQGIHCSQVAVDIEKRDTGTAW
jgi:DNA-binding IclR family transcriptional regulator